jgi:hypothetical protein
MQYEAFYHYTCKSRGCNAAVSLFRKLCPHAANTVTAQGPRMIQGVILQAGVKVYCIPLSWDLRCSQQEYRTANAEVWQSSRSLRCGTERPGGLARGRRARRGHMRLQQPPHVEHRPLTRLLDAACMHSLFESASVGVRASESAASSVRVHMRIRSTPGPDLHPLLPMVGTNVCRQKALHCEDRQWPAQHALEVRSKSMLHRCSNAVNEFTTC